MKYVSEYINTPAQSLQFSEFIKGNNSRAVIKWLPAKIWTLSVSFGSCHCVWISGNLDEENCSYSAETRMGRAD